jgi:hypothetical protein
MEVYPPSYLINIASRVVVTCVVTSVNTAITVAVSGQLAHTRDTGLQSDFLDAHTFEVNLFHILFV